MVNEAPTSDSVAARNTSVDTASVSMALPTAAEARQLEDPSIIMVEGILRQLGPCVLVGIPEGEKGPRTAGWQMLTRDDMRADYLSRLNQGSNIGILLGKASESLCTIDIDSDDCLEAFLNLNPTLRESLISRGSRGGNVWLRIKGNYPPAAKLSLAGKSWGEWRADRNQTVFHGRHPSGVSYRNNGKRPLDIKFSEIRWPDGLGLPWEIPLPPKPHQVSYPANDAGKSTTFC